MMGLEFSAFAVFLVIAFAGFVFLAIAMVFGEIFDFFGGDADHDIGDGGPSFLSGRVLSVFITAFGGTGALATHFGAGVLAASVAGFLSGLVFGGATYAFARLLFNQQASTDVSSPDLVWKNARVTVAIPANGLGQVRLQIGEEIVDKVARSKSGEAIAANSIVIVEQMLGEVAIVQLEQS